MLAAFLAGDGSIEFPDERATCRVEQVTGHVFRRFDAPASAAAKMVPRLETRENSVWLVVQALRSFFVRAISYKPSAISSSEVLPAPHRVRFLSCERSVRLV